MRTDMNNESTITEGTTKKASGEWTAWLKANIRQLRLFAEVQCRNWADAEDVLQEAFIQLAKAVARGVFDGGQEQWRAYVYKAIRHLAIDLGRRKGRESEYEDTYKKTHCEEAEDAPWIACRADAEYRSDRVQELVRSLEPKFAEVIVLHFFNGLTFQDIADITGEKLSTITSRNRYAISKMYAELQKHPIER